MPDRDIYGRYAQAAADGDTRFQFEIIKGLSESIRQMATNMAEMQKTQVDMLVRMARLEENKIADELASVKADSAALEVRVHALEKDLDKREGARALIGSIPKWWPIIMLLASVFTALWIGGRSLGIVPAPPTPILVDARQSKDPEK